MIYESEIVQVEDSDDGVSQVSTNVYTAGIKGTMFFEIQHVQ